MSEPIIRLQDPRVTPGPPIPSARALDPDATDPFAGSAGVTVVSPHSDDAAFSVAGLLRLCHARGKPITVITCFARSSYAPAVMIRTARRVSSIRKREDSAFIALFGTVGRMCWLD